MAEGQAQRQLLAKLEQSLASGIATPASIRNEVASVVAGTMQLSQQARTASENRANSELAEAQARTRATVVDISRDIYERRIFDPYLRFASTEDEAAYRRREEDNRRAIAEALAENTPEGDLRAARITNRQLQDAGAHGADASPEYQDRLARTRASIDELSQAIQHSAEGTTRPTASQRPAPATDEQLASVLAAFRAAGIGGGLQTSDAEHGLNVDIGSRDQSRGA